MAQRQQGHAAEYKYQIYMRNKNVILMPDRLGPGLAETAGGTVVQRGAAGGMRLWDGGGMEEGCMSGTSIREGLDGGWR